MRRIHVIFNPAAKGGRARALKPFFDRIPSVHLVPTSQPGQARLLARQAVSNGAEIVVAAGGDGTLNEVLNGIGDMPEAFSRVRLGLLPTGTINVFAKELGLPVALKAAWNVIDRGGCREVDLVRAEFTAEPSVAEARYCVQLAGAGLDSLAIERVEWNLKRGFGPLAYVWAGICALRRRLPEVVVEANGQTYRGKLVILGNGRYYGGKWAMFPRAELDDGKLDICVFPRISVLHLPRLVIGRLASRSLGEFLDGRYFQADSVRLWSSERIPFELDGEICGDLPARFQVVPRRLRVFAP